MGHTTAEPETDGVIRLTRTDTGVFLWTASRGGEVVLSYSRKHVERWLTLGPIDPSL